MFDIGFSELLLVAIVALIVLSPERLPEAARVSGLWLGRIKRNIQNLKAEVERELGADEIRRQLHNEHILHMEHLNTLNQELKEHTPTTSAVDVPPPVSKERL